MTTYIDAATSEVHCPKCGVRCKLPIPGPVSVLLHFLNNFERAHWHMTTNAPEVVGTKHGVTAETMT